ncbi:MAG: phosphopantetheine-binding protein [Paludibacteraceae bacterium]|nr:phosphopantetheine-binding protein [Paludibacteraceae bacterium]
MEELISNLKVQLVEALNLEDVTPEEIDADAPLFGSEGLGLDSIDALEIIILLEKNYGLHISDPKGDKSIFYSVRSLAEYITANQK